MQLNLDGLPVGPTYYVDPAGSDLNPGTQASPWRTMAGAQANVRGLLSVTRAAPITVNVNAGDYGPITFGTGDSGLGWPVIWKASGGPGGGTKATGGTTVTNWSLFSGNIYRAAVTSRVLQLWENGVRALPARTPAYVASSTYKSAQAPYKLVTGVSGSQTIVQYAPGDIPNPSGWDLNSARVSIYGIGATTGQWFADRIPISAVNSGTHQLTLSAATVYPVSAGGANGRYFCDGDLSFLTGPGQFYCDATNGFLYYWPRNTPIASQTIVRATVDNVVSFAGDSPAAPVKNIFLDGWEVAYSDSVHTYQASVYSNRDKGTVRIANALNVRIQRCNIHGSGMNGVQVFSAARLCQITDSWVHDTANYGIRVDNYPGLIAPDIGDVNGQHTIADCKVGDVGQMFGGTAIYLIETGSNVVDHCEMFNAPRAGLEIIGGSSLDSAHNYAKFNTVQYSNAHDVGQDSGDVGAFYVGETLNQVNTWNQLIAQNVQADPSMFDLAPTAFYTDNNAAGQVISNVNGANIQNASSRINNAGVSTESNVFWTPGTFNAGLMDPTIGLRPWFPY